jgi:hypothetical protein
MLSGEFGIAPKVVRKRTIGGVQNAEEKLPSADMTA